LRRKAEAASHNESYKSPGYIQAGREPLYLCRAVLV
jgi:hypothetical protein